MTLTRERAQEIGKMGAASQLQWQHDQKLNRVSKYNEHPKLCKKCSEPLPYDKRTNDFCSQSCAAKYNNLGGCKNGTPRPARYCPICGISVYWSIKTGMCKKCLIKYELEQDIQNGGFIHSIRLRKYYVSIRGHRCEDCKNTMWNNLPIPLNSHHIDGNTYNNKPDNIKLLCPNCHAQTSNFCSKNRGNGKFKVIRIPK